MYNYSFKKGKARPFAVSGSYTCREQLTTTLLQKLQEFDKQELDLEDLKVILTTRIDEHLDAKKKRGFNGFAAVFAQGLVKDIAIAQGRTQKSAEVTISQRRSPNTVSAFSLTFTMPAWVLANPYFVSFFLGVLQVAASYVEQNGIDYLEKYDNYRDMLVLISKKTRDEQYPIHSWAKKRVEALVEACKKKDYYKEFLEKAPGKVYWDPLNGFNEWYDSHGAKISKKLRAAS